LSGELNACASVPFTFIPAVCSSGEKKRETSQRHGQPGEHEEDHNQENSFITKGCLGQFILAGLGPDLLTSAEIHNLSTFAFKVLLPDLKHDDVDVKDFVRMAMQHELIDFKAITRLAQKEQQHSFLEKMLTDSKLKSSFMVPAGVPDAPDAVMPADLDSDAHEQDAPVKDPVDTTTGEELKVLKARCKDLEDAQEVIRNRMDDVFKELQIELSQMQQQLDAVKHQYNTNLPALLEAGEGIVHESAKPPPKSESPSVTSDGWQTGVQAQLLQLKFQNEGMIMEMKAMSRKFQQHDTVDEQHSRIDSRLSKSQKSSSREKRRDAEVGCFAPEGTNPRKSAGTWR